MAKINGVEPWGQQISCDPSTEVADYPPGFVRRPVDPNGEKVFQDSFNCKDAQKAPTGKADQVEAPLHSWQSSSPIGPSESSKLAAKLEEHELCPGHCPL